MKPIVDLHMHLDGSLPVSIVMYLMRKYPDRVPENLKYLMDLEEEEYLKKLSYELKAPIECRSLAEYLTKFDLPCRLLSDPESMQIATYGLLKELASEGVKYVEIRFAPQLHSTKYQSSQMERFEYEKEIITAMLYATRRVPQIRVGFILCFMRNLPDKNKLGYDPNLNTLYLMKEFYGRGVVALDLAGAEARDETKSFSKLFETAKEMKLPFTIHAGEAGSVEWRVNSLKSAIYFGAKRIGHGIALEHDLELRNVCREKGIGIECCPVSNLQTKAVCGGIKYHPLPKFLEEGLLVSVNTDNRTVSDTNLCKEFKLLSKVGIGQMEQRCLIQNAIKMSFADEGTKAWLRTFI